MNAAPELQLSEDEVILQVGDLRGLSVEEAVAEYEGIVYANVKRMRGMDRREDLVGEGFYGLMKAIRTYDGSAPFATYAFYIVRFEMLRGLRKSQQGPHTPHLTISLAAKIKREGLEGQPPAEIAEKLQKKPVQVERALYFLGLSTVSADSTSGESEETLYGMLITPADFTHVYVAAFIDTLDDRDKLLLACLYRGMKQQRIAEVIGHSQMHVSRLTRKLQDKYTEWSEAE